ncbi:MAG: hypothetical protein JXA04_04020 [Gammaproteobacteria bacterium]|nr:hypothetical protein [Gammaproteobacteria bacterium]
MQIALLCCYPILVHLSIALQEPGYRILALLIFIAGIAYKNLAKGVLATWLTLFAVAITALAMHHFGYDMYIFYLPPILIPALVASVFVRSLLPGNKALITGIVERARGPIKDNIRAHTVLLTKIWAVLLIAMTIFALLISWLASEWLWSIYTNFISYILVAALLVGDFFYRRMRFKDHNHPGFCQYISIVFHSRFSNRRS